MFGLLGAEVTRESFLAPGREGWIGNWSEGGSRFVFLRVFEELLIF
jgi:hypothetical protein